MSTSLHPAPPGDDRQSLPDLLAGVIAARAREQSQRRERGARPEIVHDLRLSTLSALVAYAEALESRSWPVPRRILQEISMHRSLLRR